jgi:hypothetical protein
MDSAYFTIQETKKSEPDTAPGHEQYHHSHTFRVTVPKAFSLENLSVFDFLSR